MAVTHWAGLGVTGVAIERVYFGQKSRAEGNLWEKTGQHVCVCVFTFHMSDLWQCPLFAALCDDIMKVQTDPRFRSRESRSHTRPILFKPSFFFHLFIQGNNWAHMFFLATPCCSFTPGSCPVQPQTSTDGHQTMSLKQLDRSRHLGGDLIRRHEVALWEG